MFIRFLHQLKEAGVPVSIREYLDFLAGLDKGITNLNTDSFYHFARASLVKDERYYDRFDRTFSEFFEGALKKGGEILNNIPEEWIKNALQKNLTKEDKEKIDSLGGWDKLLETLKERLKEQKKRHQGGNKWIGTGGTSPFGSGGYNPEGIRIGNEGKRQGKAVKVWEKRLWTNFDDKKTLGIRDIRVAVRRLRHFARTGTPDEFDLNGTISATANNGGYLDVKMVPERKNRVKLLLFLDVGGSMDPYVEACEELFSASKSEFKDLEHFYFHNCPYEILWKNNPRSSEDIISTWDIIRKYGSDYRVLFVGDASMSPYEVAYAGGSIEHWNEESGATWLDRITSHFDSVAWLNPENKKIWNSSASNKMIREIFDERMYELNLSGIEAAMKKLSR
ncbi:MAG: vWA domain-containing protein [Alphaproteobacteria bacterium]|nr:MAG: VWA domain-containing protein [Alphaproteobacteria bacterium]